MTTHFYNSDLEELAKYSPGKITPEILVDLMAELNAWRRIGDACNCSVIETPEDMENYIEGLEEQAGQCNLADHADYDDLKEYFDDTVRAMTDIGGSWPCAAAYDQNLRAAVIECIERGAEIIETERAGEQP